MHCKQTINTMAMSSMCSSDLSILPEISFAFVEKFISDRSGSSGKEQLSKGFKYYSESYIHSVKLYEDVNCCRVTGKCYRSQRKNETPHNVEVTLGKDLVELSKCSCTIGQSGRCGHITALLYQLAYFKQMQYKVIPSDLAKTSIPQTWHQPRGDKIKGSKVDNIVVQGYDRENPHRPTKGIRSTLYNPLPDDSNLDAEWLKEKSEEFGILFPTVVNLSENEKVQTKFGKFVRGSVLGYQQQMGTEYILNVMDASDFPDLPVKNVMTNNFHAVLSANQTLKFEAVKVSKSESVEIEKNTRLQTKDPRWHQLRKQRITASNSGLIAKRHKDGEPLAERLMTSRHVQTAAMKHGSECEGLAAQKYSKKMDDTVNLYPSGIVINPFSCWLAASPDRKVYCPDRNPPFGLLEIKCPVAERLTDVKCLQNTNGTFSLKKNDNYYYQVQTQLAVTGLEWCDFYIWTENETHLETVAFDQHFWDTTKEKLDQFFFNYYLY